MQTTAGNNKSCVEEIEYKDQTSEVLALKTEMSLHKELILRLVGHLYQVLSVVSQAGSIYPFIYVMFCYTDNSRQQELCNRDRI